MSVWIFFYLKFASTLYFWALSNFFFAYFSLKIWTISSCVNSSAGWRGINLLLSLLPTLTCSNCILDLSWEAFLNPGILIGLFLFISFSRRSLSSYYSYFFCFYFSASPSIFSFFYTFSYNLLIIFYLCIFHFEKFDSALSSIVS